MAVLTRPRNPHLIVLAYAAILVLNLAWNAAFRAVDLSKGGVRVQRRGQRFDSRWPLALRECWLWFMVLALNLVAEVIAAFSIARDHSATLALSIVLVALQLGLLLHPSLRFAMRRR